MSLTPAQIEAVKARGNLVVVAGAGTGKTSTLVARCLDCLVHADPPASIDKILIVTFTEAAAAEIRQRIRTRLTLEARLDPGQPRWQEQLALFEAAHIGTLHSFCLQLVRQHFYELELDPQLSVLSEEEAHLLAEETLSAILEKHYAGKTNDAESVQQLIQAQGRGSDKLIRQLVLRMHHYTQTLPAPGQWFDLQSDQFARPEPEQWRQWFQTAARQWREQWLPVLKAASSGNPVARDCSKILAGLDPEPDRLQVSGALRQIVAEIEGCQEGKISAWIDPLKYFVNDARFLASVAIPTGEPNPVDPLEQDWGWVRPQMVTLLRLAREFSQTFADTKRELGVVDFHDLEQHSLRLLVDPNTGRPTQIAREWQAALRFVFVDEYQDINAAQDKIIAALSREGPQANRFLVGDVKQSIYRFRLANPHIFQGYVENWGPNSTTGRSLPLVENFRSRETLLDFVNSLFADIMRRELGGVAYDEQAMLRFGAPVDRRLLSSTVDPSPCVELQLRLKSNSSQVSHPTPDSEVLQELLAMAETEKEARSIALRLLELKEQQFPIWDDEQYCLRPVQWGDMAVLLRSPAAKSESYAKEFSRLNVPLLITRSSFYEATEVTDLLSLLKILDNPLQDLPLLAVLHSPLVGLTATELASIRLAGKGTFWSALVKSSKREGDQHSKEAWHKVTRFLERFYHWRRLARQVSLSRCLDVILSQTYYAIWLLTQPRGEQRHANVQRLVALAQQFDRFRRQGLFRFLCFIEAQQLAGTEPEVAAVNVENSVRLMSIHQSKGLEFPIVVVADLGKQFNLSDLRADIILDEDLGLCPQIKPPQTYQRYPSLPHWMASRHQRKELLGEEIRLLYVATTRARDKLILAASLPASRFEKRWRLVAEPDLMTLGSAQSYSDWIGLWFARHFQIEPGLQQRGASSLLQWSIFDETRLTDSINLPSASTKAEDQDPVLWQKLSQRLAWEYPFASATQTPAKASVTTLRRGAMEWQPEEEIKQPAPMPARVTDLAEEGVSIGIAHHKFLQLVSLNQVESTEELKREAKRLLAEKKMTPEEVQLLDFSGLTAFWQSEVGRQVRSQAESIRRELVFTARFSPAELAAITGETMGEPLSDEFIVVQGVVDLAVILPSEIWLVDFKTDQPNPNALERKVKEYQRQLQLYALALTRVYRRPVKLCWLYFLALRRAIPVQTS